MAMEPGATPPAITTQEAKAYLRIETDIEDELIAGLILVATGLCEAFTGQALVVREFREIVPARPDWRRLARTPVRAIGGVEGLPAEGAAFALPVDGYAVDIDANGDGWVRVLQPGAAGRAIVTYDAGMAEAAAEVPEPMRQGIVRLVAHMFAYRDAADEGRPPAMVAALWRPWRRVRLR
jgi:uncharacterized phiE125 gp8 family phage protein